jgi:hypothetical protein
MDGGSADHAGSGYLPHCGRSRAIRFAQVPIEKRVIARKAGSYSVL